MAKTCPDCGTENSGSAQFCKQCGCGLGNVFSVGVTRPVPLDGGVTGLICVACGELNGATANFCRKCGTRMGVREPAAPPRAMPVKAAAVFADTVPGAADADAAVPVASAPEGRPSLPPEYLASSLTVPPSEIDLPVQRQALPNRTFWTLALAVALALALGGGYWWSKRVPSSMVPPADSIQPGESIVGAEPAKPAAVPGSTAPPVAVPPSTPMPIPAPTAVEATAVPVARVPAVSPPVLSPVQEQSRQRAQAASAVVAKPLPRPAPAKPETPVAEAVPATQPAPASPRISQGSFGSPTEACASRPFIARTWCVYTQCNSAQFKSHPQCVKLREEGEARQQHGDSRN
jgi:ribosomal protein L40E